MKEEKFYKKYQKIKNSRDFDVLIDFIENLENGYVSSSMLLDKIRAILLSETEHSLEEYDFDDILKIFELIIENDPTCIEVYIEKGYFYHAILDDDDRALEIIETGLKKVQKIKDELENAQKDILNYKSGNLDWYKDLFD